LRLPCVGNKSPIPWGLKDFLLIIRI